MAANRGGGSRQDSGNDGNGYFADDEPAPARPAPRPASAQAARPAQAPAPRSAPAAQAPASQAPRKAAAPATYDDDFDDSDPFADE